MCDHKVPHEIIAIYLRTVELLNREFDDSESVFVMLKLDGAAELVPAILTDAGAVAVGLCWAEICNQQEGPCWTDTFPYLPFTHTVVAGSTFHHP